MRKRCAHLPSNRCFDVKSLSVKIGVHHLVYMVIGIAKPRSDTWLSNVIHVKLWHNWCRYGEAHKRTYLSSKQRNFYQKSHLADRVHKLQDYRVPFQYDSVLLCKSRIFWILVKGINPAIPNSYSSDLDFSFKMEVVCNRRYVMTSKRLASDVKLPVLKFRIFGVEVLQKVVKVYRQVKSVCS